MHDHVSRSLRRHCCLLSTRDHPDMFPLHDVLEPANLTCRLLALQRNDLRNFVLYGRASEEREYFGGAGRDRTDDLKLAKLPLSQLSYGPTKMVGLGRLELPTSRLSSARSNQLSYKPKLSRAAHEKPLKRSHARGLMQCSFWHSSIGKKEKRRRRYPADRV